MRIAFDLGGVVSKYPQEFTPLLSVIHLWGHTCGVELWYVTDMAREKALDMIRRNSLPHNEANVVCADFKLHGDACKAVLCKQLGIDILVDDHPAYVSTPDGPTVRLLAMPDITKPYYHDDWKTDGSEGAFGRRNPPGSKRPPEDRGRKDSHG